MGPQNASFSTSILLSLLRIYLCHRRWKAACLTDSPKLHFLLNNFFDRSTTVNRQVLRPYFPRMAEVMSDDVLAPRGRGRGRDTPRDEQEGVGAGEGRQEVEEGEETGCQARKTRRKGFVSVLIPRQLLLWRVSSCVIQYLNALASSARRRWRSWIVIWKHAIYQSLESACLFSLCGRF